MNGLLSAFRLASLLLLAMCFSAIDSAAQTTYAAPKVSAKDQRDFDEAVLASKAGKYAESVSVIRGLADKYPTWTSPWQELARMEYEQGHKAEAILALETTLAIDTASQLNQLFTLAKLYEETNAPDRAIACYKYFAMHPENSSSLTQKAKDNCQALKAKKALYQETYAIAPKEFDPPVNSDKHESLGRWSLDGSWLLFTRLIEGQEDIFMAERDADAGTWKIHDFAHNTTYNEGAHAISPDGHFLAFTACNRQDGRGSCDLYISAFRDGAWTKPANMGPGFNTSAWDGHPCFGVDGATIFFSSSREGGYGGRDIWYMTQVSGDSWTQPANAGPQINTPDNEESPFVHFDGRTLYFMRDGKEGLGGYDLYIARLGLDGRWEKAENLGAPINTGANEGALSLHPNGHQAIITRENGANKNDLFEIELPEKFRAFPQQALFVKIVDKETGFAVQSNIEVFEIGKDPNIRLTQWTDGFGNIITSLRRDVSHGILVNAKNYLLYSANLLPDTSDARVLTIELEPLARSENKTVVLENVFFETGSAAILPESETELDKLLWSLKTNQALMIEIQGHTDDVGDETSNMELSVARARAVYTWLTDRGIPSHRVSFRGYGETQPIVDNSTPEGRRKNRRTAFQIRVH